MRFDYKSYCQMLDDLKKGDYRVVNYHDYKAYERCVILRHDIDFSLSSAVQMAELEASQGVHSTYFVLVTSDFYNVASASSLRALHRIQELGHEVGLHFDEVAYGEISEEMCIQKILEEKNILSTLLGTDVTTVSMHRPSKRTLESDLHIPGMINSYGKEFFHGFKYVSDSRRRWREPVDEIIADGSYERLHILTHAFWYHETEEPIEESVGRFIRSANVERYHQMADNITDLSSIMGKEEI